MAGADLSPEAIARYAMLANMENEAPSEQAQEQPKGGVGMAPYLAMLAGQGADAATTAMNYKRGLTESNPMYGKNPSLGKVMGIKGAEMAGLALLMKLMADKGSPKAAKIIGYMGGVGGAIPAAINASVKK